MQVLALIVKVLSSLRKFERCNTPPHDSPQTAAGAGEEAGTIFLKLFDWIVIFIGILLNWKIEDVKSLLNCLLVWTLFLKGQGQIDI